MDILMYTKILLSFTKECKKSNYFLSVFDVLALIVPIDGKITYRHYTMGSFLPAFKDDVGFENESYYLY